MPDLPRAAALFQTGRAGSQTGLARALFAQGERLQLGDVGRNLFDGVMAGAAAGLVGAGFFAAFEYFQRGVREISAKTKA